MITQVENHMAEDSLWSDEQGLARQKDHREQQNELAAERAAQQADDEAAIRRRLRTADLDECLESVDVYDVIDKLKITHPGLHAMITQEAQFMAIEAEIKWLRGRMMDAYTLRNGLGADDVATCGDCQDQFEIGEVSSHPLCAEPICEPCMMDRELAMELLTYCARALSRAGATRCADISFTAQDDGFDVSLKLHADGAPSYASSYSSYCASWTAFGGREFASFRDGAERIRSIVDAYVMGMSMPGQPDDQERTS